MKKRISSLALAVFLVLAIAPATITAATAGTTVTISEWYLNAELTNVVFSTSFEDGFEGDMFPVQIYVVTEPSTIRISEWIGSGGVGNFENLRLEGSDLFWDWLDWDDEGLTIDIEQPFSLQSGKSYSFFGEMSERVQILAVDSATAALLSGDTKPPVTNPLDTASSWARGHIESALAKGFIPEDIQGNYKNVITRAEFCRMAVKWVEYALGQPVTEIVAERGIAERAGLTFSDTTDANILAAYRLGITAGSIAPAADAPGQFNPSGEFTRQEAATMIMNTCRAIGADVSNPPAADFGDMDKAGSWARPGISFVRANGIMSGDGTNFNPSETYTREQSITTFNNIKHGELPGR